MKPAWERYERRYCSANPLPNHVIRTQQQRLWDGDAEHLRGLEIDHDLKLGRLFHRKLGKSRPSLASLPSANYQPYAFPPRGPRKNHRIKPSSGSNTTAIV